MAQRLGLIIGNSEYEDPNLAQLKKPNADVNSLAEVLKNPEIGSFDEVTTLINQPCYVVRREIARFFSQKRRDDLLLLYFSGHGVKDDLGRLYLAVKNTEHDLLSATAVPAAAISDDMDQSRSRRLVLILDCCHSGAFPQGSKGVIQVSVGTREAFRGNGYGRVVLTATDATQYAWEGDKVIGGAENSVYTHYLIQGLRTGDADANSDSKITLDELHDYVYEQVAQKTPKQTPRKSSHNEQRDIVIAHNLYVRPTELPPELRHAIENEFPLVRQSAVNELAKLLQGNHRGLVLAAQQVLEHIAEHDDSRRISNLAREMLQAYHEGVPSARQPATDEPVEVRESALQGAKAAQPMIETEPTSVTDELQGQIQEERTEGEEPKQELLRSLRQPATTSVNTFGQVKDNVGGPRFREDAWYLPDEPLLGFVEVPAGPFLMGSARKRDSKAFSHEAPQHQISLPQYWIARYPVTVAQFKAFLEDTGYRGAYADSIQGPLNHPVVNVSWHHAIAYSKWLTEQLRRCEDTPEPLATGLRQEGWRVTLPSEVEWEKAARGSDGRIYPWGNEFDPVRANTEEIGEGSTSAVGSYPSGTSPYGCLDMAGNVWEWTRSLWEKEVFGPEFKYPYNPDDGREDMEAPDRVPRVLRGGAFLYLSRRDLRCANRLRNYPNNRGWLFGFRTVVLPNKYTTGLSPVI
jgi:formylglycine-generating enzyme required for sulfatase activity